MIVNLLGYNLFLFRIIKNNLQNDVLAITFASEIKTNKNNYEYHENKKSFIFSDFSKLISDDGTR